MRQSSGHTVYRDAQYHRATISHIDVIDRNIGLSTAGFFFFFFRARTECYKFRDAPREFAFDEFSRGKKGAGKIYIRVLAAVEVTRAGNLRHHQHVTQSHLTLRPA